MKHMKKTCPTCRGEFEKPYTESVRNWINRHKFCSRNCYIISMKGKDLFKPGARSHVAWNKGIKMGKSPFNTKVALFCKECGKEFLVKKYRIKENARFCSRDCAYKSMDNGLTPLHERVRKSKDYAIWRAAVFVRDNYTCQICHIRGGVLNVDHIKPFSLYPELRLAIDNGRTLCNSCHKQTDTFGFSAWRLFNTVSVEA